VSALLARVAGASEILAAVAIGACLLAAAILPVTQHGGCEGELDRRVASALVGLFGDLAVRDQLRAEALAGSPAGRWDAPWDRDGVALAACDRAPAASAVAMAW